MKINRLETHDRFEHFTKQEFDIGKTCQDMIDKRPFGDHPFYIFAHKREIEADERVAIFNQDLMHPFEYRQFIKFADVPTARLIWQPRLTKPRAQSNSMLFKAYPGTDTVKVIWMIPAPELWKQYEKGKMLENQTVCESIDAFKNNPQKLEAPEEDDLDEKAIDAIYRQISRQSNRKSYPNLVL